MNLKTREITHRRHVNRLREAKRLRALRREIHVAMVEAKRMARSRKRGTSRDVDINMETLGWKRVKDTGSVEEKYQRAC
jgi:hypothetical protein